MRYAGLPEKGVVYTREEVVESCLRLADFSVSKRILSMRILDIGCGRGEWLETLASKGYDGTGIDLNQEMIKVPCFQKIMFFLPQK